VSLLVGTVVTVVSALVPARRATKVLPVEALRESTPGREKPSVRRGLVGLVIIGRASRDAVRLVRRGQHEASSGSAWWPAMVGVMVSLPLAVRRWQR
jgi:putative ABC transport system permease protein